MNFGERIKARRGELELSRGDLAKRLGVSPSAVSNYENGLSFPKEDVMLRLFDSLETEPNILFQDSFRDGGRVLTGTEQQLLRQYRGLSPMGRETVRSMVETLCAYRDEVEAARSEQQESRVIPLYRTPAAAGYPAPVCGEDFDELTVTEDVPPAAEFAVRVPGDEMAPFFAGGEAVCLTRSPLRAGDVGLFALDGRVVFRQYRQDSAGMVHLFALNRRRAQEDLVLTPSGSRSLICFGRVIMTPPPLPEED